MAPAISTYGLIPDCLYIAWAQERTTYVHVCRACFHACGAVQVPLSAGPVHHHCEPVGTWGKEEACAHSLKSGMLCLLMFSSPTVWSHSCLTGASAHIRQSRVYPVHPLQGVFASLSQTRMLDQMTLGHKDERRSQWLMFQRAGKARPSVG